MRKPMIERLRAHSQRRALYRALDNASPSMRQELQSLAQHQNVVG
jgi:hypothetical protein